MNTWRSAFCSGLLALAAAAAATSVAASPSLVDRAKRPPKDAQGLLDLGVELRRGGLYVEAARVLRRAYPRATKGELAVRVRLEAARALIDAGEQQAAVKECRALGAVDPSARDVCTAEAHLLWKRASLALPLADGVLERTADHYDALVAKGRALEQMGQAAEAEAALKRAATVAPSRYEAHYYLGEALAARRKTKEALAALERAVAVAPEEPAPWLALGSLLPVGAKAREVLEKATALRPGYGAALARLGELRLALGDREGAKLALEQAIAGNDKVADWHASLGRVHLAGRDAAAARAASGRATKLVSNHAAALLVLADALALEGDIDLAIEAYERAFGHARTDPTPLVHAARACLSADRPTTARAFADRATQEFAEHGPAWEVRGDVAIKEGDRKRAKLSYQRALAAKSGSVNRAGVSKKLAALR